MKISKNKLKYFQKKLIEGRDNENEAQQQISKTVKIEKTQLLNQKKLDIIY